MSVSSSLTIGILVHELTELTDLTEAWSDSQLSGFKCSSWPSET